MQIIGKLLEKLIFGKNDRKIDIQLKNGKCAMKILKNMKIGGKGYF